MGSCSTTFWLSITPAEHERKNEVVSFSLSLGLFDMIICGGVEDGESALVEERKGSFNECMLYNNKRIFLGVCQLAVYNQHTNFQHYYLPFDLLPSGS